MCVSVRECAALCAFVRCSDSARMCTPNNRAYLGVPVALAVGRREGVVGLLSDDEFAALGL